MRNLLLAGNMSHCIYCVLIVWKAITFSAEHNIDAHIKFVDFNSLSQCKCPS